MLYNVTCCHYFSKKWTSSIWLSALVNSSQGKKFWSQNKTLLIIFEAVDSPVPKEFAIFRIMCSSPRQWNGAPTCVSTEIGSQNMVLFFSMQSFRSVPNFSKLFWDMQKFSFHSSETFWPAKKLVHDELVCSGQIQNLGGFLSPFFLENFKMRWSCELFCFFFGAFAWSKKIL